MTDAPSNIQLCAEIVFILRQQGMRSLWQWSFEKGKWIKNKQTERHHLTIVDFVSKHFCFECLHRVALPNFCNFFDVQFLHSFSTDMLEFEFSWSAPQELKCPDNPICHCKIASTTMRSIAKTDTCTNQSQVQMMLHFLFALHFAFMVLCFHHDADEECSLLSVTRDLIAGFSHSWHFPVNWSIPNAFTRSHFDHRFLACQLHVLKQEHSLLFFS